ncbi:phosphotransferase [Microbacterium sp. ET2]|uniref:phosphotransferase n=1 Tax=Microbacterium albipurpureum TaxID=3050384 RepID=UPI00259C9D14|nr:phosphotransferase [Microbacterium sp. ET2 (Ac-2212)]WJL95924.1 phosphotransferase [Microbacterium sp. ET2 (Ac-2212)]
MARSSLTLAASVTSALPGAAVVGVAALTENSAGRYDSALVDLDDGRRVVVRAPVDDGAAAEAAAEVRALTVLTSGVRGLLPFRVPTVLGQTPLVGGRAVVADFLPGYRVDPPHLPSGRGAATSLGEAIAAIHALPVSVIRDEGLPARTTRQLRDDIERTVERAVATRRLPPSLDVRWSQALNAEELWRFETTVVLGGAGASSFLFEDFAGEPRVTGVLDWHGLSVGDPAGDFMWLASAPDAADDVFASYLARSVHAPDGLLRERARLYAELEFARWLVHGHETGRSDIVDDAVELLESLAAGVAGDDIVPQDRGDVDDAIALLDRVPGPAGSVVDTSMQTDAYDPAEVSGWFGDDPEDQDEEGPAAGEPTSSGRSASPADTAPLDLGPIRERLDDVGEAERASQAALRRWAVSPTAPTSPQPRRTRSSAT